MLAIVMGLLDVITSFVLVTFAWFGWFSTEAVLYHAMYVMLKGAIFFAWDFASKVDLLAGIYIVLVAFGMFSNNTITVVVAFWLLQKGMFSLLRPMMSVLM